MKLLNIGSEWAKVSQSTGKSSDFIVGKDKFESLVINDVGAGTAFSYFYDNSQRRLIKRFILGVSKTGIRTCCAVTFISKDGRYTPRLELSKRKNNEQIEKEDIKVNPSTKSISSRIELNECHENFWALIDYIQSIRSVDVPRNGWSAISQTDRQLLNDLEVNRNFVQKVLATFPTPKAQELLIEAKKDDVTNLYAAVKQARNKKALKVIDELIVDDSNEHILESWIKENDWVFGVEYVRRLDGTRIGLHADSDILVESLDGFVDLIELKKASVHPLFIEDRSHPGSYYPSAPLSQVIGQTIHYLSVMNDQRFILKSEDGMNVLKPRAKIVIGQSSLLNEKQKEALRKLNDTLHGIEIITYDEIKHRAKRIVHQYSGEEVVSEETNQAVS